MSSPLKLRVSPRALTQIEEAAQWWAQNRPAAPNAIQWARSFDTALAEAKRTNKLVADADWTSLEVAFELPNSGEVELICELRADKGEVWFDRDSLRLIKSK